LIRFNSTFKNPRSLKPTKEFSIKIFASNGNNNIIEISKKGPSLQLTKTSNITT